MGSNSQIVFRERERGRPAAVPSLSCSSCPQEVRKEVADPGRRYSRVNNSALLYEELFLGVLGLGLREITALQQATARAERCFLSGYCTASSLSGISYAPGHKLPPVTFPVKAPSKTGSKWSVARNAQCCFKPLCLR